MTDKNRRSDGKARTKAQSAATGAARKSAAASRSPLAFDDALVAAARTSTAWPFEEARKLIARLEKGGGATRTVLFETGYGPSGLPHIGTFGEVARTTMVRNAFRVLTSDRVPTRLICFSDDMDGLRKVPDNVPNKDMLSANLDKPLTVVPDPFGKFDSFGHHNNAMLRSFLDRFGFDYEFFSATECYRAGRFDATLQLMLERYDEVMAIMLPTLGEERQRSYSPFLPLCRRTERVMQVPMVELRPKDGTIVWQDPETGALIETPITGGNVKCQWKADWAMRWVALGIDYEMAGKDLIDSVTQSSKIARALGGTPPDGFSYELFLDHKGQKISKSKGNGLSIDEWLTYATPESLSLYMFQKPRTAKKLFFDVIPRTVDDYLTYLAKYPAQAPEARLQNPVWHIHSSTPPAAELPLSFALLLNLASVSNAEQKDVLWGYIRRYAPGATAAAQPLLDDLAGYAVRYYHDFVKPAKTYRAAKATERTALEALQVALAAAPSSANAEALQNIVYEVGKSNGFADDLRAWFGAIYEVLLGQTQGPRFGSFIELYGLEETRVLIRRGLAGELLIGPSS